MRRVSIRFEREPLPHDGTSCSVSDNGEFQSALSAKVFFTEPRAAAGARDGFNPL